MKKRVSILLASYLRTDMLMRCVKTLWDSIKDEPHEVQLVTFIDCNRESLAALSEWYGGSAKKNLRWISNFSETRQGVMYAYNEALAMSTGDYILAANDDFEFNYPGWLSIALDAHDLALSGYGMVGINEVSRPFGGVAYVQLMDRWFIRNRLGGRITFPIFKSYYSDTLCCALAWKYARFHYCPEAKILHKLAGAERLKDNQDDDSIANALEDNVAFSEWTRRGEQIEWEPLI